MPGRLTYWKGQEKLIEALNILIEDYNVSFNSNDKYLYLTTYVDTLKEFIQYDSSYYKVNDYTETTENIEQVSENLWKLYFKYDLKKYRRKYKSRVVPDMIDLIKYMDVK